VFRRSATDKLHARLFGGSPSPASPAWASRPSSSPSQPVVGLHPARQALAAAASLVVFALRRNFVFARLDFALPQLPPDIYVKVMVAGAVFFFVIEFAYFDFSAPVSFWKPSLDAFGGTAIGRDFLNTWMGGRSAFAEGPAAWFDFRAYNQYLIEFIGVPECTGTSGRTLHIFCCSSGRWASCPTSRLSFCGPCWALRSSSTPPTAPASSANIWCSLRWHPRSP
jgi:hypothetical protein